MKAQARAATERLAEAMAVATRRQVRREVALLVRAVFNARSYEQAESALVRLQAHASRKKSAKAIHANLDAALMHLQEYNRGLLRVAPEWLWRDLRLRLSSGRNRASNQRQQRAMLVWAIYGNFAPAQSRSERTRHYHRPGQSPLAKAGVSPGQLDYLDALEV